jgi:protein ImuA
MNQPLHAWELARVVQELGARVRQLEASRRPNWQGLVSSGTPALDGILPGGGFRRGSLVEWLAEGSGSGAGTLALLAAAQAARQGGAVVVVDFQQAFYPPAAVALGIELAQLIVVRPENEPDHRWALDQVLRSRGVAALWCRPATEEDHTWRRWQLAAETSGVLGLFVRPASARHEPSWAELRLSIEPIPCAYWHAPLHAEPQRQMAARSRRLRVEVLRLRGGRAGPAIELEIPASAEALSAPGDIRSGSSNHETRAMHLASPVAAAKTGHRSQRA